VSLLRASSGRRSEGAPRSGAEVLDDVIEPGLEDAGDHRRRLGIRGIVRLEMGQPVDLRSTFHRRHAERRIVIGDGQRRFGDVVAVARPCLSVSFSVTVAPSVVVSFRYRVPSSCQSSQLLRSGSQSEISQKPPTCHQTHHVGLLTVTDLCTVMACAPPIPKAMARAATASLPDFIVSSVSRLRCFPPARANRSKQWMPLVNTLI
jgi:hypothetical protein